MKNTTFKRLLVLLTIGFSLWSFKLHKQYFSLTKIYYKKNEKTLQITMQVFTDDLEKSLTSKLNTHFELNSKREHPDTNTYLKTYIHEHFALQINGKSVPFRVLGKEYIKDETYIYLECKHIRKNIKDMEVRNDMIMEIYPEQENIVKLNINNQRKSLILNIDNPSGKLTFKK